jgi:hypothetical protein
MLTQAPVGVGVAVGTGVGVAVGPGVGVAVGVGVGVGVPVTRLTVMDAEPSREPPPLVHERTETEWFPSAYADVFQLNCCGLGEAQA